MLPITARSIRLTLHVLGVTVWVGGQLTLLGILPALRAAQGDVAARVARRFERVAWPAFAVVIVTGIWNVAAIDVGDTSSSYQATLLAKLAFVALSGVGAFLHGRATSRAALALWGAVGLLAALVAVFYGVQLASS
jgi:putative copper export protein